MKKLAAIISICFGICMAIDDDYAYFKHTYQIMIMDLKPDEEAEANGYKDAYAYHVIRRCFAYAEQGQEQKDASDCFLVDFYKERTGLDANNDKEAAHSIKHFIEENYPGHGDEKGDQKRK